MPDSENSPDIASAPAAADSGAGGSADSGAAAAVAPAPAAGPDYAKLYEESSGRLKQLEEYVPKLHGVFERMQKAEEARLRAMGMIEDEKPQYLTRQDFEKFARTQAEESARVRSQERAEREIEGFMAKQESAHPEVFGDPDLRDLFYARVAAVGDKVPLAQIADAIVKAAEARSAKWLESYGAGKSAAPRVIRPGAGGKISDKKPDLGDQETRIAAILGDLGASA